LTFPVDRSDQRCFEHDWSGDVVVCDIDRTYLYTRFSSMKGLTRIPFEFAIDKRDIAGMVPLLKELRRGPDPTSRHTPLYFVSASPPQLRTVIERKMLMDGVEYDGTTFKDWRACLRSGRLGRMKDQVGFKLTALLHTRLALPRGAREVLIGDDLEKDALAYCLYADIVAGRLAQDRVPKILTRLGVARPDAWGVADLAKMLPHADSVRRIVIRLEKRAPDHFADFQPHVHPCRGPLQMALSLRGAGCISDEGVGRVAKGLAERGKTRIELDELQRDARQRGLTDQPSASDSPWTPAEYLD
jgi:hypothetical protein